MNASTFTARVVASTGADVAAALSRRRRRAVGPAARRRARARAEDARRGRAEGDAERWVKEALDHGERLMGFGHRVYRAEDPRAARPAPHGARDRLARASRSPRRSSRPRWPSSRRASPTACWPRTSSSGRPSCSTTPTCPRRLFTPMFTCARTAGWAAHILEQKREARLIRPTAKYVGPGARASSSAVVGRLADGAAQEVAQRLRVGLGERGELRRRRARAPRTWVAHRLALRGQRDRLHAPVALGRAGARPGRRPPAGRRSP